MDPVFERADFDDSSLALFLQAHLDDIAPTAPAESRHALDLSELRNPAACAPLPTYEDEELHAPCSST
ncbi:hypothetical protein [Rhodococcus sp. NPDC003383]